MGRPRRVFVADGIYHVVSRGSNREPLYRFDGDRVAFIDRFATLIEDYELDCFALVLMTTHYHASIRTPDGRLSDALRDLHGGFSRLCSRVYGRDAHLFRNRFTAELVDGEAHLLTVLRYVHLNPVRAGICRDPSGWPWSSYRATVGLEPAPAYLALDTLFGLLGPDRRREQERYRQFVEAEAVAPRAASPHRA